MRDAYTRQRGPAPVPHGDLHVCLGCQQPFVVPDELLALLAGGRYLVRLRCANCERLRIGIFDEDEMTALDIELSRGEQQIRHDADVISRALFEEEIEAFASALRHGILLPEDF